MASIQEINDALREVLNDPLAMAQIRKSSGGIALNTELVSAAKRLAWDIGQATNEYGLKIGFNSYQGKRLWPYSPPVNMYYLEDGSPQLRTFITQNQDGIVVTIHIDEDAVWQPSLYERGYPDGTPDIIGLLTQGYTSNKKAFYVVGGEFGSNRRTREGVFGASNAITSRKLGNEQYGFPKNAPFVKDAIAEWEAKYSYLNAKVIDYPANWH